MTYQSGITGRVGAVSTSSGQELEIGGQAWEGILSGLVGDGWGSSSHIQQLKI